MKLLLVLLLLAIPVAGWGAEDVIFKKNSEDGSLLYMVKTTAKPNVFLWYNGSSRCFAVPSGSIVLMQCPGMPEIALYSDHGDVTVSMDGKVKGTYTEGSVLFGMYTTVVAYKR